MAKRTIEIEKYRVFSSLFENSPITINIGNATKIYLGSAEKVPVEAGIKTASKENNI